MSRRLIRVDVSVDAVAQLPHRRLMSLSDHPSSFVCGVHIRFCGHVKLVFQMHAKQEQALRRWHRIGANPLCFCYVLGTSSIFSILPVPITCTVYCTHLSTFAECRTWALTENTDMYGYNNDKLFPLLLSQNTVHVRMSIRMYVPTPWCTVVSIGQLIRPPSLCSTVQLTSHMSLLGFLKNEIEL